MQNRRPRRSSALLPGLENLEGRMVLSTLAVSSGTAEIAAKGVHKAATTTTLAVSPTTLGQPVTFHATVTAAASAGAPQGTIRIIQHGEVLETMTLSPTTSNNARTATSSATGTITQQPGGNDPFFGKYPVTAQFIPATGAFSKSAVGNKAIVVSQPAYTPLANGVNVATVVAGSGPAIQTGQTASVLYTGYLASTGTIFDASLKDGGTPFTFKLGSGQVIPGFDAGTVGMQVGETRVVEIPASQGYGATSNGAIPANSSLIFVLTLESIS